MATAFVNSDLPEMEKKIKDYVQNGIGFDSNDFSEEYKSAEFLSNLEKDLRGENMPKGVPKKDGSGRGRGQSGKGCGGNPRKRKGANR